MPRDSSNDEVTPAFLSAFAEAWIRHDTDAILSMMTPDWVMEVSAGIEVCGRQFAGRDGVRRGILEVFEGSPEPRWINARHFIVGDRSVSEWVFTGTKADGTRVQVNGCAVFAFRDGKIAVKNSYRK